jgi:hypothetical protein
MSTENKVPEALAILREAMADREPGSYYDGWKANIAMAFVDQWMYGPDVVADSVDVHRIANKAANVFLNRLLGTEESGEHDGMMGVVNAAQSAKP